MPKSKGTNRFGFTLIELMIVVAIIGVLAAIAIPSFVRYQLRSKTSEARLVINGIRVSEDSYFATTGRYAGQDDPKPGGLANGIKRPWVTGPCATGSGNLNVLDCTGFQPSGDVYYNYEVRTETELIYTIGAEADLDGDGVYGSFCFGTPYPGAADPAANGVPLDNALGDCVMGGFQSGTIIEGRPNVY